MTKIRNVGNFDNEGGRLVIEDMILDLNKSIAYDLAEENREDLQEWRLEEFACAIYLLAIFGELSKLGPEVHISTVQRWRDMYFHMYDERYAEPHKADLLRANIVDAFERLEAVATLYPPNRWLY